MAAWIYNSCSQGHHYCCCIQLSNFSSQECISLEPGIPAAHWLQVAQAAAATEQQQSFSMAYAASLKTWSCINLRFLFLSVIEIKHFLHFQLTPVQVVPPANERVRSQPCICLSGKGITCWCPPSQLAGAAAKEVCPNSTNTKTQKRT